MVLEEPVLGIGGLLALKDEACVFDLFDVGHMGLLFHFPQNGIGHEPEEGLVRMPQQILALHLALRRLPYIFMRPFGLGIAKDEEFGQIQLLTSFLMEKGGSP